MNPLGSKQEITKKKTKGNLECGEAASTIQSRIK